MLKTLEEPLGEILFILVTSAYDALLPTIRSRAVHVAFGTLPAADIEAALAEHGMGTDAAVIAALADGSLGRAYDLAAAGFGGRDDALALLTALPTLCAEDIWKHAEAFGALSGEERAARLDFFRMGLRDLLVLTEDGAAPIFHADRRDRLASLCAPARGERFQQAARGERESVLTGGGFFTAGKKSIHMNCFI